MELFLIIFIVAVALAPLTHFVPTKRQRQVSGLREFAAVHGLFVEFRDLPGSERAPMGGTRRPEQIIYYGKRLPPSRGEPRARLAWRIRDEGFYGVGHHLPAPACIELLPAEILALSQEEGSCGVYWLEPGEEADVQQILGALEAWSETLVTGFTEHPKHDFS
ncbi:hypothetical protein [Halioglobus maricola]|uniref:hypothetical protein n=1 Tax=Halioglobus maricola TaxID=2601894 RepID=UPI00197A878A|nr:hypothetical protein [Halioglobus maricola]